ncbi:ATP--cobalamin adenosyltransferase [Endozoicomonas montiporae]|uniref:Corrinoid adenosyltransferase n=2 Tax=Endozoicomonas montiporae TaxID=1027273 RepID=A0A081N461_9GAMM|nr:cob(I)yrinic acid a,c-diamide adenosyltransferase [Endozoicomonas montiporae]AMO57933.1 ethanolamine utilization cobalamin adenosyltransferase [Endozoicomonas montiporae CL-33]KEQ13234.1 ATP--cobalamin adenosyltransferase [Endozoicomonas montiporae]
MADKKQNYRLTRIYTRTGDKGTSRLGDGQALSKSDARFEAIGTVDELNSWMGMLLNGLRASQDVSDDQLANIEAIQHRLFDVGGELAMPGYQLIQAEHTEALEQLIDELNAPLPPLTNFTLPGGGTNACHCHMVRTVGRRAERAVVRLHESGAEINAPLMTYLNRLSDVMYVLSRHCARQNEGEVLWQASPKEKL